MNSSIVGSDNQLDSDSTDKLQVDVCGRGDATNHPVTKNTQDMAMHQVQEIMQDLERKREADKRMVEEFRLNMQNMVDVTCEQIEQRLMMQYEDTNKQVEIKLQYLNEIVERVCGFEQELDAVRASLSDFFRNT